MKSQKAISCAKHFARCGQHLSLAPPGLGGTTRARCGAGAPPGGEAQAARRRRWDLDAGLAPSIKASAGRGGAGLPPALRSTVPLGGAWDSREPRLPPPAARPDEGTMELEPELLLQEARESVVRRRATAGSRSQRLQGLVEARRQAGGPRLPGRCGPRGGRGVPAVGERRKAARGGSVRTLCAGRRQAALKAQETWLGVGKGEVGSEGGWGRGS